MKPETLELLRSSSHDAWRGHEARDFTPTPAQAEVMGAVRAATDSGMFYTRDVLAYCIEALDVPDDVAAVGRDRTEGGEVGMHCYYAREANDAADYWRRETTDAAALEPRIGKPLGCIMWSDHKRVTGAVITGRNGSGAFRVQGKRGRLTYMWDAPASTIMAAIDRYKAHQTMRAAR